MSNRLSQSQLKYRERDARLGTIALLSGFAILVLRGYESVQGISGMPRFWQQNPTMWFVIGVAGIVVGWRYLLWAEPRDGESRAWRPVIPGRRFREVVIYSRANCPLCDEAADVLADYAHWLPQGVAVNIDGDPELLQKYDTLVPVVACDGKVRFRGRVDERLLRRLIEGTAPVTWQSW